MDHLISLFLALMESTKSYGLEADGKFDFVINKSTTTWQVYSNSVSNSKSKPLLFINMKNRLNPKNDQVQH